MGKRLKPDRVNIEEFHAKICIDMILEFKSQIKLETNTDEFYNDRRKLQDYNMQQFRNYIQRKIISL